MKKFNPQLWFGERELKTVPPHFIKCTAPVTDETMVWVRTKLTGRFSLSDKLTSENFIFDNTVVIAFEDPGDAVIYELRWSGSK